jgi:hypothetical protein
MKTKLVSLALTALAFAALEASPLALAQTEISSTPAPTSLAQATSASPMQGMDRMSDSVTKMSEMCQMMMQKEMAGAPYKIAGGIGLGALLLIALVLFVILEIQWIIYWSRLLKCGKLDRRS